MEWGGYNTDGTTWAWDTERPGWGSQPIRQMMEANGVTAFFHGHDHQMAYETANGMVYQAVPSASFSGSFGNYTTGNTYTVRDGAGGTSTGQTVWADSTQGPGRLRVTVGPDEAEVEFVRYNQTSTAAYSYTMEPGGTNSLAAATIAAIANQTYTGSAITPAVTVTLGATTLVRNTDYTVAYANNTNVGTATVTVTGIGSYTGSKQTTFQIVRATPSVTTWPTASAITLGQALSASTLSGGSASVAGSFAFTTPATVPASTGPYTAGVTFTPSNANYNPVTGSVPGAGQPLPSPRPRRSAASRRPDGHRRRRREPLGHGQRRRRRHALLPVVQQHQQDQQRRFPIGGATAASYAAPTGSAGTLYYCVVTNTNNGVSGTKTATGLQRGERDVNTLTNAETPTISGQPADVTVTVGGTAGLAVGTSARARSPTSGSATPAGPTAAAS